MEDDTKSYDYQAIGKAILYGLYVVCSFLLVLVALPFLLPISLIFRIYRHTQIGMIRDRYPDAMMVSGEDSVWLQDSVENPAIINTLVHLDGRCDIEKFQNVIQRRLVEARDEMGQLLYPKLQRYATKLMHRFVWMQELDFDIKDHVYEFDGKAPTNMTQVHEMTGEIISHLLPSNKSPWQFIILPYRDDGRDTFLMLARVHHSVGDGVSLMRMIMANLVDKSPAAALPKRFGAKYKLLNAIKAVVLGPALLTAKLFWPRDSNTLHGPKPSGTKIVSWSPPIELDLIKKLKSSAGATVNDVLVSCLGGALNQYFTETNAHVPENVSCYVPVDIRSATSKNVLDNQFALVFLSLPTETKGNLERVQETKQRMDYIKSTPEPVVAALTIKYAMNRLPKWLTHLTFDWFSNKCTMVLSNVPGPQEILSVAGHKVSGLIFWPPQRKNVVMGVSILSYNGHVRIGVMVDKVVTDKPERIVSAFINNVRQLATELKVE